MRSLWKRGLKSWPYLVASLAFLISTGFATQYGMDHKASSIASEAAEVAAIPGVRDARAIQLG